MSKAIFSPNTNLVIEKKQSTALATILLADNIRKNVDKGNLVGAVFVDLLKAFDTL